MGSHKRFQILCLSGGGYLGLYTASVLRQLEEQAGVPVGQCFDLIAGTSVGGIIGLGLAAGKSAKEIEAAFLEHGSLIFSDTPPSKSNAKLFGKLARHTSKSFYGNSALKKTINSIVPEETTIGDLGTRVLIPAVNLSKGKPQVFKTAHHPTFMRDHLLKVEDVALATSAAPTFFPTHTIASEIFTDGGLYANSPDHIALHEATHFLEQDLTNIHVLSIGTTSTSFSWSNSMKSDLGWFDWAKDQRLIKAMMASQQINVDYMMGHILGDQYVRLDASPSCEQQDQLGIDVATEVAKKDLTALANATVRENISKPGIGKILGHRAQNPIFYN